LLVALADSVAAIRVQACASVEQARGLITRETASREFEVGASADITPVLAVALLTNLDYAIAAERLRSDAFGGFEHAGDRTARQVAAGEVIEISAGAYRTPILAFALLAGFYDAVAAYRVPRETGASAGHASARIARERAAREVIEISAGKVAIDRLTADILALFADIYHAVTADSGSVARALASIDLAGPDITHQRTACEIIEISAVEIPEDRALADEIALLARFYETVAARGLAGQAGTCVELARGGTA